MSLRRFALPVSLATIILGATAASAQPLSFGFRAGGNAARMHDSEKLSVDLRNRAGAMGGVWARASVWNGFGVQTEALASVEGARVDWSRSGLFDKSDDPKPDLRLTYLRVPVLIDYVRSVLPQTRAHVQLGPQVGYLLNYREEFFAPIEPIIISEDGTVVQEAGEVVGFVSYNREYTSRWDVGVVAGAGFLTAAIGRPIGLDLRYVYGLSNTTNRELFTGKRTNRVLSLSLTLGL